VSRSKRGVRASVASAHVRVAPDEPRFSAGIAVVAWLAAFVFANVGAVAILAATGHTTTDPDELPIWITAVLQVPLWVGLVGAVWVVSHRLGTGNIRRDYGFEFRTIDLIGFPIGVIVQLVFVNALYWLLGFVVDTSQVDKPARDLTDRANGIGVFLLIVLVVVGAPIIEELFFRGLLLRSIEARWTDTLALIGSAVFFGAIHFELLQFPALVLFGLVAGYCAQRTGRLGMSVFAHAGFNATTVLILLRG
jgi:uncharacterized protein